MVIGVGENKANGRRCLLISFNEEDVMRLIGEGIELNAEVHAGFPTDIELCLAVSDDGYVEKVARTAFPNAAVIPQTAGKTRES